MKTYNIRLVDIENIVITDNEGNDLWFNKKELKGPKRCWFDNIMACTESLVNETSS